MDKTKFFLSLFLALSFLSLQARGVLAAPALTATAPIEGIVQSITLETDATTGVTMVIVHILGGDDTLRNVRISQETAITMGIVVLNGDGRPVINGSALGIPVEIDPQDVIPDQEENQHPVANALATFFSDLPGINYEIIMSAHEQGTGFGVIAQMLWLTTKMDGDVETFETLLDAKQSGDYSAFVLADGSTPKNWGQLRKAILEQGKKQSLGLIMSNSQGNGEQAVPKNDKNDHPNGNQNNGHGNHGDNGKGKDKD